MASELALVGIRSICRRLAGGGRLRPRLLGRGEGPAAAVLSLRRGTGRSAAATCKDKPVLTIEPKVQNSVDRFSDRQVAREDRQFVELLDRMLDAIRNPQSLAKMQREKLPNDLRMLDDGI